MRKNGPIEVCSLQSFEFRVLLISFACLIELSLSGDETMAENDVCKQVGSLLSRCALTSERGDRMSLPGLRVQVMSPVSVLTKASKESIPLKSN